MPVGTWLRKNNTVRLPSWFASSSSELDELEDEPEEPVVEFDAPEKSALEPNVSEEVVVVVVEPDVAAEDSRSAITGPSIKVS